jgi:hypothetical protein
MQGSEPLTGKMPVPQVLLLKDQHSINNDRNLLPITDYPLPITHYRLPITDYP